MVFRTFLLSFLAYVYFYGWKSLKISLHLCWCLLYYCLYSLSGICLWALLVRVGLWLGIGEVFWWYYVVLIGFCTFVLNLIFVFPFFCSLVLAMAVSAGLASMLGITSLLFVVGIEEMLSWWFSLLVWSFFFWCLLVVFGLWWGCFVVYINLVLDSFWSYISTVCRSVACWPSYLLPALWSSDLLLFFFMLCQGGLLCVMFHLFFFILVACSV